MKDTPDGKTHYQNDGCGEPAHNDTSPKEWLSRMFVKINVKRTSIDIGDLLELKKLLEEL